MLNQLTLLCGDLLSTLVNERLQAVTDCPKTAANGLGVLPWHGGVVTPLVARFITNLPQHIGVGIFSGLSKQRFQLLAQRFAAVQVGLSFLVKLCTPWR